MSYTRLMRHRNSRVVIGGFVLIAVWGFWAGSLMVGLLFLVMAGVGWIVDGE